MRHLRILIFSPYFAPHVGGVETFVGELGAALLNEPDVAGLTVLAPALPPGAPALDDVSGRYRIVRYPAFDAIPNFPVPKLWTTSFWRAVRAAAPRGHDVLMTHTRFFVSSAMGLVLARLTGRRLLHVEHGSDFVQLGSDVTRLLARAYDELIGREVLRRADAVVAISAASAGFVRRLAGREASVIYRGFWPDRIAPVAADPQLRAEAHGRPIVSYVGRLIDGKGVADLVRAFANVSSAQPLLCVVGDGPRRRDLELLAQRLGIRERVRFLGYVEDHQALAAIMAADVVVNPSYTEGLPTTVLEAALLGRAVLATDVGGTSEIIEHDRSGVLVRPRDVAALTRELERLLADPELRDRLGRTARVNARGRFDWTVSARRFLEVAHRLNADQADSLNQST